MSIETKVDEHDEQGRNLHRWACLVCSKRGVWLRDLEQARAAMRSHRATRQHLERLRQRADARGARGEP